MIDKNSVSEFTLEIKEVANMINNAVKERELIIFRHHADGDGYSGALVIEEVILPIIQNLNMKAWQKYRRMPLRAPFYAYMDALKDIELCRSAIAAGKKPLIILLDVGSGEESLLAIKRLKQYPVNVLIIDHHVFSEEVATTVDKFLNSRTKFPESGEITAGILGYEVACKIGEPRAIFPALSAVSDHSSEELIDYYSKLAGKSKEDLEKLARCFDFEAHNLGYSDFDSIYDFFNEKQEQMIKLLYPIMEGWIKETTLMIQKFMTEELKKDFKIYKIDVEKTSTRGDYMSAGKVAGIMHRLNEGKRVSFGFADSFVTIRADHDSFSVIKLINYLKEKLPYAKIGGGGHDCAGTIKFIPAVKIELEKEINSYLDKL